MRVVQLTSERSVSAANGTGLSIGSPHRHYASACWVDPFIDVVAERPAATPDPRRAAVVEVSLPTWYCCSSRVGGAQVGGSLARRPGTALGMTGEAQTASPDPA